jgi:adenine-specific DNA-methyltransferase
MEVMPVFKPSNRKYLGSKRLLSRWICSVIREVAGAPTTFLDGFCGTGAIAIEMSRMGAEKVIAVDNLESNCVILRGFKAAAGRFHGAELIPEILKTLNALSPLEGYITESFQDTYFTRNNCMRMDAVREEIAALMARGEVGREAHDYLLTSFLLEADRVANTLGQYDAFLKNISSETGFSGGRHVIDLRVHTPFVLKQLARIAMGDVEASYADLSDPSVRVSAEIAYFDPPYNGRQYCDNYHILENLARWQKPPVRGKTRKFDRSGMKSPFSTRAGAAPALRSLIRRTSSPRVFLSYSSEGIMPRDEVVSLLSDFGAVKIREVPYPVFGNGAGVSRRRLISEYLFALER